MRYLFFDIECCVGAHICEFGYVITDENFNPIEKKDITINPKAKFYLTGRPKRPDIELFYTEEHYYKSPEFPEFYKEIKRLLEHDNQIIMGHAISNDADFINRACKKYDLAPINFQFHDSQKIYKEFFGINKSISLEKAGEKLNVEFPQYLHKSDEDSELTMKLVKSMCEQLEVTLPELIDLCPSCIGRTENFIVRYNEAKERWDKLLLAAQTEPDALSENKKRYILGKFLKTVKKTEELTPIFKGKSISISLNYELTHFREAFVLIQLIVNHGGKYKSKSSESNIFVEYPLFNENGEKLFCARLKYVEEANAAGKEIQIVSLDEFLTILGITEDNLKSSKFPTESFYKKPKIKQQLPKVEHISVSIGDLLKAQVNT